VFQEAYTNEMLLKLIDKVAEITRKFEAAAKEMDVKLREVVEEFLTHPQVFATEDDHLIMKRAIFHTLITKVYCAALAKYIPEEEAKVAPPSKPLT
jgi:hypothetical protein